MRRSGACRFALLAAAVALGRVTLAEEAVTPPGAPGAESAPRPRAIEEIIVTAQKKTESIQEVPISMTVLGGDFLREAGIDDMHELVKYAPNVRFSSHVTVFVRGFGTPFSTGAFDPSVGLALDELSIPRENYMGDPLYDIEQFEVLRGPQGTLFGKNTPAGLFNVKTARPTRDLTGYVLGRIGGLGVHRVEAATGGPVGTLGDLAQFRLAVVDAEQEKDIHNTLLGNSYPDTKQRAGRLQLALQPLAGLDVLLIGEGATTDTGYTHTLQTANVRDTSIDFLRRFDPDFEADGLNHKNSINLPNDPHRETDRLQTNLRYALGDLGAAKDLELVAVLGQTGFDMDFPFDVDVSPADILNLDPETDFNYDQRSLELRASGVVPAPFGFGEIEILAGALVFEANLFSDHFVVGGEDFDDYLQSPAAFELVTGSPPPGGVGFPDVAAAFTALGLPPPGTDSFDGDGARITLDQKTRSQAIFGNLAWRFLEDWTLGFGARLTSERKRASLVNECLDPGLLCPVLMAEEYDVIRSREETNFSPKATLQYAPIDELNLFVTRGEGFKSGGYNNLAFTLDSVEVDSEKVVSWEAGARGTLFDAVFSYGVTLFRMDAEDLQLQNVVGALVQTRNAASARSQGLELDFEWLTPWEPLSIHGAGALTDARFKEFPGAIAPANSAAATQDLSGRRMPFVPKRQLNLTPNLRFPLRGDAVPLLAGLLPRDLAVTAALDLLHRSSFFLDSDLDERLVQGDSWMLDGRIGFGSADDSLTLGLAVKNITDAKVLEFATDSILFPPGFLKIQEFQRTVAVELRYGW